MNSILFFDEIKHLICKSEHNVIKYHHYEKEGEKKMVQLEDFFDFNSSEPINRLAYTEEDMKYKIKVIEKMQELGMTITVDKVGNICGSIAIGSNPEKTLAMVLIQIQSIMADNMMDQ